MEAVTAGVSGLGRVKQRSREGLEEARKELEEREKVGEELHAVQVWLQAAHGLLGEMEQSSGTEELQVGNFLPSQQISNCCFSTPVLSEAAET